MIYDDQTLVAILDGHREMRIYDDGSGPLWSYREYLGILGIVRAETWEDAYECVLDAIMDDADETDPENHPDEDGSLPEGIHYRPNGSPGVNGLESGLASEDLNGSSLDLLTDEMLDELDLTIRTTGGWADPSGPSIQYEDSEWVEFLAGITGPIPDDHSAGIARDAFSEAVVGLWNEFIEGHKDADDPCQPLFAIGDDEVAFRSYCSLTGHGIGLWDGEIMLELVGKEFEKVIAKVPYSDLETEIEILSNDD